MILKVFINILLLMIIAATGAAAQDKPASACDREYQIKAAFLYNFIKFTDWPDDKIAEPNTIIIGLFGENKFEGAFDAVKDIPIKNKKLIIRNFGKFSQFIREGEEITQLSPEAEQLKKCHILFVCDSEWAYTREIIEAVKDYNVLTVGETGDFLGLGGIVTFIPGTEKPVFDINREAAKKAQIQLSSRVLRLARKVLPEAQTEDDAPKKINK